MKWLGGFRLILMLNVLLPAAVPVLAQQSPPPDFVTTDDPRRVPIPPPDRSKDPILVLRGGTLIDGTGAPPVGDAVLVMQGDRILDVGPSGSVQIPAKVEREISTQGLYILPGLIDLHIHFTQQRGNDFSRYRDSDAAAALRGALLLGQLLDGGITAVRDVGTRNDVALKLKEAVERKMYQGPRIFWCGKLIASRGGHGDEVLSTATGRPRSADDARVRVANGPDDWRLAVREQIRELSDWIKITAPYTREEVAAAVDEAHMHGIRVAADAFGEFVTWGVEAGLDSVEHPLAIPDETIALMAKKGTGFVPTMVAFYNVIHYGYPSAGIPAGGFYYTMSRRFPVTDEGIMHILRQAHQEGVKTGIGTDVPFENEKRYPSDYFTELGLFQEAGYSNEEILASATRVGAQILGMDDKLGTLKKGMIADVLVVAADPLAEIQNLRKMRLVVADGEVVRDRLTTSQATTDGRR